MNRFISIALFSGAIAFSSLVAFPAHGDDTSFATAITNAQTPADHEALAQRFEAEAQDLTARAAEHQRMATSYQTMGGKSNAGYVAHCEKLTAAYREAAQEDTALAKLHRQFAGQLQK